MHLEQYGTEVGMHGMMVGMHGMEVVCVEWRWACME